jgi:hypothetical protein
MADELPEGALPLQPPEPAPGVAELSPDAGGVSGGVAGGVAGAEALASPEERAYQDAVLRLIQARSLYLVGLALAVKFPTEEAFEAFLGSEPFVEGVLAFASVRRDILLAGALETPDAYESTVSDHARRAHESLEVLSELLETPPEDLVSVLVR